MKFYPKINNAVRNLLISVSVMAILFAGLQAKHFSSPQKNIDTLQEVAIGSNNAAILPFVFKTVSVDFYALPEVLFFKKGYLDFPINVVQSAIINTYYRNVYFVFTSIHAP